MAALPANKSPSPEGITTPERIETIDEIKPIFSEYLDFMSQFFKIYNYDSWCKGAFKNLQKYSMADDRYILVIKESGSIFGFALVNQHLRFNSSGLAVAEFYIKKNYAKTGHGRNLAEYIFHKFPGHWEVAVTSTNKSALIFWEKVVSSYTDGNFIKKEKDSFNGYGFIFNTD